jgi:hypothetical protein
MKEFFVRIRSTAMIIFLIYSLIAVLTFIDSIIDGKVFDWQYHVYSFFYCITFLVVFAWIENPRIQSILFWTILSFLILLLAFSILKSWNDEIINHTLYLIAAVIINRKIISLFNAMKFVTNGVKSKLEKQKDKSSDS